MSNKKQTAVEWLQSIDLEKDLDLGYWNRAKEMEKQQIINANEDSSTINGEFLTGEQYYNETYGGDTIQNKQERMYSEEEVIKIVEKSRTTGLTAEYLIKQFKHKQV
jgi:hypothetical protein